MVRKGFGIRLLALLIDGVILMIAGGLVNLIFVGSFRMQIGTVNTSGDLAAAISSLRTAGIVGGLVQLAYWSLEIFRGQSVGKMLLKLQIADQSGAPAPQAQLVTRYLAKTAFVILGILFWITMLMFVSWIQTLVALAFFVGCFFTLGQAKQALHDMIAKTAVYGPGTEPVGFQPIMPGSSSAPPQPGA